MKCKTLLCVALLAAIHLPAVAFAAESPPSARESVAAAVPCADAHDALWSANAPKGETAVRVAVEASLARLTAVGYLDDMRTMWQWSLGYRRAATMRLSKLQPSYGTTPSFHHLPPVLP